MTMRRKASLAAAAALALGLMTACGDSGGEGGGNGDTGADEGMNTLERIQEEGKVVLAVAEERPYSWIEDGEGTGATVDMHREIFGNLGVDEVEVVEVDWNALIPGLNAERYDAVSAGMSILPERCAEAAFSDPEIMYTTTLMVPEGNPKNLSDLDSVVQAGDDVHLAVLAGGIEDGYADSLGIDDTTKVDNAQDGMDVVASGRADAFAMTAISLNWMVDNNPDSGVETTEAFQAVIDGEPDVGAGSTVFRKADTELLDAYNEELAKITGDVDKYMEIVGDYGFTEENLPPEDLTTEELCTE
ncbi:MAG TPA: ectoine/hydroxyectoine ABC transporter substrate-binding protein EhuB [Beutenbergiaceae bacterium]|nr:ectoine/hydroxyectoine ABC transporter substrate-binding protein EhuB [Beutenbergiaceae bacterium]